MSKEKWRPLQYRASEQAQLDYDTLVEGVPDWLAYSIVEWAVIRLPSGEVSRKNFLERVERVLRCDLNWSDSNESAATSLIRRFWDDREFLLSFVDYLLTNAADPIDLEDYLSEGGSAWRVASDQRRLERRLLPEVTELGNRSLTASGNAGDYLRLAWRAAFGRGPQPNEAFDNGVKAMEAALAPLVLPKDQVPTLGKIIKAMSDAPNKWEMRLGGKAGDSTSVLSFAGFLNIVWASHFRHAAPEGATKLVHTPEEARDAVVIAAQVVQLVSDGGFKSL